MDSQVKITRVSDQVGFNPQTLAPLTNKIVTFTVGEHGPFNVTLGQHEFTPEKVNEAIDSHVNTLRQIGAIR
jgi:hypothetical protein